MEIYLCHMVMFRVIEKMGFVHLFASDVLSYGVTTVGTIVGAVVFSLVIKKALYVTTLVINKFKGKDI